MPLGTHPWIGQAAEQIQESMPVAGEWMDLFGMPRLKLGRKPGQFRVRKPNVQLMCTVKRLVQQ
jgi:hypothetical protein